MRTNMIDYVGIRGGHARIRSRPTFGKPLPWLDDEDATLAANYGTLGPIATARLLPGRTPDAVKARARFLGVPAGIRARPARPDDGDESPCDVLAERDAVEHRAEARRVRDENSRHTLPLTPAPDAGPMEWVAACVHRYATARPDFVPAYPFPPQPGLDVFEGEDDVLSLLY
jgi:hypothetical protein